MTLTPQLAQQCLEALESCNSVTHWPSLRPTINALREALASGEGDEAMDAARYRWIRKNSSTGLQYSIGKGWTTSHFMLRGAELDEVIDRAAMKGNGK